MLGTIFRTEKKEIAKTSKEELWEAKEKLDALLKTLKTSDKGLSSQEAKKRLDWYGYNQIVSTDEKGIVLKFLLKFVNPLVLSLIAVAIVSFFLGEHIDSVIVILMALFSVILSFVQEHRASKTAKKLSAMVKVMVAVKRDGKEVKLPLSNIVPGDIIKLSAGKMVPADVRILSSNSLYVTQSALNGESFPVEKDESWDGNKSLSIFDISSLAFMGSSISGGMGEAVVLKTGRDTEFGKLSHEISKTKIETSFDKGISRFVMLMIRLIVVLVFGIFAVNFLLRGNFAESMLFALAVAVGLTPEMLPMVVTINLSKGARDMSKKKVIVKELAAIQNFGAMNILCTDKTGTLTLDQVALVTYCDMKGNKNPEIFKYAYLNSFYQAGMENILDKAVVNYKKAEIGDYKKAGEIPFDFVRRIVSVIVQSSRRELIAKGAPEEIFKRLKRYRYNGEEHPITDKVIADLKDQYDTLSADGFRVLAIATREIEKKERYTKDDEKDLTFLGFVSFLDPPKPSAIKAVDKLSKLGIQLKILSGDNMLVTRKICNELHIETGDILDGNRLDKLDEGELRKVVQSCHVFTRLNPVQKERIIKALQQNQNIVGFLGDGINDAPSLKAADVGISVDNATDIAKEIAPIILLEKNLGILADCITEGRRTFANTIKYIKMGASSNFGNMLSMAGASFLLPFLPMMPTQILLNNLLYDVSQVAIPTDNVDAEYLLTPRPWDIKFIRNFIIYIGPLSSIFDFVTFGMMLWIFHAPQELFHTGWFVESLTTQVFIVYIIRTSKIPFLESRPSKVLLLTTLGIVALGAIIPYTVVGAYFGFKPLPAIFFLLLAAISLVYLLLVQGVKGWFTRKFGYE